MSGCTWVRGVDAPWDSNPWDSAVPITVTGNPDARNRPITTTWNTRVRDLPALIQIDDFELHHGRRGARRYQCHVVKIFRVRMLLDENRIIYRARFVCDIYPNTALISQPSGARGGAWKSGIVGHVRFLYAATGKDTVRHLPYSVISYRNVC